MSICRTTKYAQDVRYGEIIAGPCVRDLCDMFLNEINNSNPVFGRWHFVQEEADKAMTFYENALYLPGDFGNQKFNLLDWEAFIVGNLFGWIDEHGNRRYRNLYCETGKGSGKTPLVAGTKIKFTWADHRRRARFAVAAASHEQGVINMNNILEMALASPAIAERLRWYGKQKPSLIWDTVTDNRIKVLAFKTDARGIISGEILSASTIEEYHEHPNDKMYNFVDASKKVAKNPLLMCATNSGANIDTSPCGELHKKLRYALEKADESLERYFAYICQLDKGDDPRAERKCWHKTNPSLTITPGYEYIEEQLDNSKGLPSKEADVMRLLFCKWNNSAHEWLSPDLWFPAQRKKENRPDNLHLRKLYMSLDLSRRNDLTAAGMLWEPLNKGENYWYEYRAWLPETRANNDELDGSYYGLWANDGYLDLVDGDYIDYDEIALFLQVMFNEHNLILLAFDPYRIRELKKSCEKIGLFLYDFQVASKDSVPLILHYQGKGTGAKAHVDGRALAMPRSIEKTEEMFAKKLIEMEESPLLNWCMRGAKTEDDGLGNRCFVREGEEGAKIDPIVTLVMCGGAAMYESDGDILLELYSSLGNNSETEAAG